MNIKVPIPSETLELNFPANIQKKIFNNSVSRLQSISAAVHVHLEYLKHNSPLAKPSLITFNAAVESHGDGNSNKFKISREAEMQDLETLLKRGKDCAPNANVPAKNCCDTLIRIVDNLVASTTTALGPAVVLAIGMASDVPGSKVMVCTDGEANIGLGSVSDPNSRQIYSRIGTIAKNLGVTVNVLTIRGDSCKMEFISLISDLSGGSVEIVDPLDLSKQVTKIMSKAVLGTGVTIRCLVSGKFIFSSTGKNIVVDEIGNVTSETDLTFNFGFEPKNSEFPPETDEEVFFQVQITYTRHDGARVTRVLNKKLLVTHDRDALEGKILPEIVALNAIQKSAELAHVDRTVDARVNLISVMRLLQRGMKNSATRKVYVQYIVQAEKLDGWMRQAQVQKEFMGIDSKKDDSAAKNIVQMKSASIGLFFDNPK
eukprot:TRINITY_DN27472_c0_g1_i1.p1 TRINITY_DN27472_c0_g1~~TRINITY_DN27472_c0_g1_i1.p1  ORF type:complete len:494 (+),score=111.92 TRINITY_DN27472_c0_g1_i1:197-1483(+)